MLHVRAAAYNNSDEEAFEEIHQLFLNFVKSYYIVPTIVYNDYLFDGINIYYYQYHH